MASADFLLLPRRTSAIQADQTHILGVRLLMQRNSITIQTLLLFEIMWSFFSPVDFIFPLPGCV